MHLVRRAPAIERHPGIALLLGTVEVAVIAFGGAHRLAEIGLLGLDLLQTDYIRVLAPHPVEEALRGGGADAVKVEGNDAHKVRYKFQGTRYKEKPANGTLAAISSSILVSCILYLVSSDLMKDYQREFLDFCLATGVLRFGEFTLKSGSVSPYFFYDGLIKIV